jgi:steroid delta-isomerase-like uncharacterized protein
MSTEENKAIARRLIEEAWNQGNLDAVEELLADDHNPHHSMIGEQPPSRELYKQFIIRTRAAFPDLHATIEDQIAEGDKVVTRWSVRGTHHGKFQGHNPTGNQMRVTGIVIDRIVDGKVVEGWMEMDTHGQMHQLGVVPPPGTPG